MFNVPRQKRVGRRITPTIKRLFAIMLLLLLFICLREIQRKSTRFTFSLCFLFRVQYRASDESTTSTFVFWIKTESTKLFIATRDSQLQRDVLW
jgi:hypothetical protein